MGPVTPRSSRLIRVPQDCGSMPIVAATPVAGLLADTVRAPATTSVPVEVVEGAAGRVVAGAAWVGGEEVWPVSCQARTEPTASTSTAAAATSQRVWPRRVSR